MKLAYWPGCVSRGFTTELHGSMSLVAERLGIELVELDRANCCGAGVIAEHNQELADTLNARTFALAQQTGLSMMNICSTCQGAQSECQQRLDADSSYRAHINEVLSGQGLAYEKGKDGFTNKNFLWLLVEDYGLDKLASLVKRPLSGLRVGPFYGCYIVRPKERLGYHEFPDRDIYLEQVITALGAQRLVDVGAVLRVRVQALLAFALRALAGRADVHHQVGAVGDLLLGEREGARVEGVGQLLVVLGDHAGATAGGAVEGDELDVEHRRDHGHRAVQLGGETAAHAAGPVRDLHAVASSSSSS